MLNPIRPAPASLVFTSGQLDRVIDAYELQTAVAEAQDAKHIYCMRLVADLHQQCAITSQQAMDWLMLCDSTIEYPEPFGDMWFQFRVRLISDFLDAMLKAERFGARNLLIEVDRTLYLPPLPPHRPGLIERLVTAIIGESS